MTQIDQPGAPDDAEDANASEERRSLQRVVIGAVLGFLAVYALIVFMCWRVGISLGAAFGLGVFVALFGGAGFGAMMGGSMKTSHES